MIYVHSLLKRHGRGLLLVAVLGLLVVVVQYTAAQTYTYSVLYNFPSYTNDAANPGAALVVAGGGKYLYGTSAHGGAYGNGTVFEIKLGPPATENVAYSFTGGADGALPMNKVTLVKGNLYGTTYYGGAFGYGTVFRVTTKGKETVLYSFTGSTDGGFPNAGLVPNSTSTLLYGTTSGGGADGYGTVFEVPPTAGSEYTVIYSFKGTPDGASPGGWQGPPASSASTGGLLLQKGSLYGTTSYGGNSGCGGLGCGTVFNLSSALVETVLYRFAGSSGDGIGPEGTLTRDAKGNLYGATYEGGAYGYGTVFKLTPSGAEQVLYSFTGGADGAWPDTSLLLINGKLYGTAYGGGDSSCDPSGGARGCGVIFELTPSKSGAWTEAVLHTFEWGDGAFPGGGGLVKDAHGNLYGAASNGGTSGVNCYNIGCGVVFKLTPN
jgi:uncharacterized repeat protein (TIGR03803 family)